MKETVNPVDASTEIIQKAMENVLAEFIIKLEDGSSHMVYITKFTAVGDKIEYEFSTLTEDKSIKERLVPHIEHIFSEICTQTPRKFKLFK